MNETSPGPDHSLNCESESEETPEISGLGEFTEPMADLFLTLIAVFLLVLAPRASEMPGTRMATDSDTLEEPVVFWLLHDDSGALLIRTTDEDLAPEAAASSLADTPEILLVAGPGIGADELLGTAAMMRDAGPEVTVAAGSTPPPDRSTDEESQ